MRVRFITSIISAAVAFAYISGYAFTAWFYRAKVDIAATGMVAGLIFSLPLAAILFPFYARTDLSTLTRIGISACCVVASALVAVGLHIAASALPLGSWQRVPPPPEPPLALVGPACTELYEPTLFVTTQGGTYALECDLRSARCDWHNEPDPLPTGPDTFYARLCPSEPHPAASTPMLGGTIIATRHVHQVEADCGGTKYYALLDDRSLWEWGEGSCAIGNALMIVFTPAYGAVSGLIAALLFIFLRPKPPAPNPNTV